MAIAQGQPGATAGVSPGKAGPRVIHELPGRLRVHLPDWSGADPSAIAEAIMQLPGVWDVQANALTGNLLVTFDPKQADPPAILSQADRGIARQSMVATKIHGESSRPSRRQSGFLDGAGWEWDTDFSRVVTPLLHLLLNSTPLGVPLHVAELLWALAPRRRSGDSKGYPRNSRTT